MNNNQQGKGSLFFLHYMQQRLINSLLAVRILLRKLIVIGELFYNEECLENNFMRAGAYYDDFKHIQNLSRRFLGSGE